MAGKSVLPMIALVGVGALVLTKGKKKPKKKTATAPKAPIGKDGVVASGSIDRVFAPTSPSQGLGMPYEWRVRKSNGDYLAEVGKKTPRDLKVSSWEEVGKADNMEDAKTASRLFIYTRVQLYWDQELSVGIALKDFAELPAANDELAWIFASLLSVAASGW